MNPLLEMRGPTKNVKTKIKASSPGQIRKNLALRYSRGSAPESKELPISSPLIKKKNLTAKLPEYSKPVSANTKSVPDSSAVRG